MITGIYGMVQCEVMLHPIFGADKRWGTFGSVGVGWNIHNEKWVKDNTSLFQMLKLRASWGITGGTIFILFRR